MTNQTSFEKMYEITCTPYPPEDSQGLEGQRNEQANHSHAPAAECRRNQKQEKQRIQIPIGRCRMKEQRIPQSSNLIIDR